MHPFFRGLWLCGAASLAAIVSTAACAQSGNPGQNKTPVQSHVLTGAPPLAANSCEDSYLDPPIYKEGRWWFCGRAYAERPDFRPIRGWTVKPD